MRAERVFPFDSIIAYLLIKEKTKFWKILRNCVRDFCSICETSFFARFGTFDRCSGVPKKDRAYGMQGFEAALWERVRESSWNISCGK